MPGDVLMISGIDSPGASMYGYDFGELLPPEMMGYDGLGAGLMDQVRGAVPSAAEFQEGVKGSAGALLAIMAGRALETSLYAKLPVKAVPVLHLGVGLMAGKYVAGMFGPTLGLGFGIGMGALGIVRGLRSWFGMDMGLSGFDDASLSDLASFGADDDLLPAELQDFADEGDWDAIEVQDRNFSQVTVEPSYAGFRIA